ncbi:hypothetical protein [uncultured Eubacterium sp.]|uniref:hypothetical protein n=1 Tax=uncultured Eubacterium sp. TaxID=165185 RepID=UPI002593D1E8|nr:hypothetical protein [uncultured Eubacterium sp.]
MKFKQIIYGKNLWDRESQILYKSNDIEEDDIATIIKKISFQGETPGNQTFKYFPLGNGQYALMRILFFSASDDYADTRNQLLAHCIIFDKTNATYFIKNLDFTISNTEFANNFKEIEKGKFLYIDNCINWQEIIGENLNDECRIIGDSIKSPYLKYILIALIENRQLIINENNIIDYKELFKNIPSSLAREISFTIGSNSTGEVKDFRIGIFSSKAFNNIQKDEFMNMPINLVVFGKPQITKQKTKLILEKYKKLLEREPLTLEELAEKSKSSKDFFEEVMNYKLKAKETGELFEEVKEEESRKEIKREISPNSQHISKRKKYKVKSKVILGIEIISVIVAFSVIIALSQVSIEDGFNITLTMNDLSIIQLLLSGFIGYIVGRKRR